MSAANPPAHSPSLQDVTVEEIELIYEASYGLDEACNMLSKEDQFTVKHLAFSIHLQRICSVLKDKGNIPALFKFEAVKSKTKSKALQRYMEVFSAYPEPAPEPLPEALEEGEEMECILTDGTVKEMTWLELFKAYKNLVKADRNQLFVAIQKNRDAENFVPDTAGESSTGNAKP